MACVKCGYRDKKETFFFENNLCQICAKFAPEDRNQFLMYISEKIDWKLLDTFRKFGQSFGNKQKQGMDKKAKSGFVVTRAPLGYDILEGKLIPNQDSSKVHSLFTVFLNKDYSLNSLSKNYGISLNGLKKILKNRTYLGEIKFDKKINKGNHEKLISDEIFYAVQRKLKEKLKNN